MQLRGKSWDQAVSDDFCAACFAGCLSSLHRLRRPDQFALAGGGYAAPGAEGALDLLTPMFETGPREAVYWAKVDRDLDSIREHPRFKALLAAAEARLAQVLD